MDCAVNKFLERKDLDGNDKNAPCQREDNCREAITELIEAVAEQQEALAKILEAEHGYHTRAVSMISGSYES